MRNKKTIAIAGITAIMVIGGTWAYFSQSSTINNPFSTGKYSNIVVEDFKPEDGKNWQPGATVNKDIEVQNTGDYDLLVRVKFDENWYDKNSMNARKTLDGVNADTYQESATDGEITNDKSVVAKTLANADKWVYNAGYWYYKTNLLKGTSTEKFLDSVTLLEDADMGKYEVKTYYTAADTAPDASNPDNFGTSESEEGSKWIYYTGKMPETAKHSIAITEQETGKAGYSNADYVLTITVETVQATEDAVKGVFGLTSAPTDCTWEYRDN